MFPIRDSEPTTRRAHITWLLVAATALAFVFQSSLDETPLLALVYRCGIVPATWFDAEWTRASGLSERDPWPLLTSLFLHGGWLHLVSNLWALWIFGDNVEERLGATRFLFVYVACGLLAGALHVATNADSRVPTIGASGAIGGVMGAYFVLFPRSRVTAVVPILCFPLLFEMPALIYLGVWFLLQLTSGVADLGAGASAGGIAWWAHIGGFVAGIAAARLVAPARTTHGVESAETL